MRRAGVIYFVRDGEFIKIGYTERHISHRLKEFECSNPRQLELLITIPSGADRGEWYWHWRFHDLKLPTRKEWFRYEGELKTFIDLEIESFANGNQKTSSERRREVAA